MSDNKEQDNNSLGVEQIDITAEPKNNNNSLLADSIESAIETAMKSAIEIDDNIPENFVFNVELIIRDYKGIDQNTDSRKELAEAIRLVCEEVLNAS